MIKNQLIQRQNLQVSLNQLQHNHEKDRYKLIRDLSHMKGGKSKAAPDFSKIKDHAPTREEIMQRKSQQGKGQSQPSTGMEPEI